MNDIDNLWKRTEALNSLIGECRMRIDRLETHLAKLESSDARHIVVAPNAPANGPESPLVPETAERQAATPSSPTEATDSVSAPPTSPSPSEPSYGFPAYPGKLSLKIGEAQSAGIELTSIAEAIQKLIDERKSGASNTSNAGSSND